MSFKENINKIHFDVSSNFENVIILEKSSHSGNYIELTINEGSKSLITILKKSDLEKNRFDWSYKSNPNDENSFLIERNSSTTNFVEDVRDIFEKNRFDSDYIKIIESNSFSKEDFIGKKITNISQDNFTTIETETSSFTIGCSGSNTTSVEGDLTNEIISDIIIDEYDVTILSEGGGKMYVEDDTNGEGVEIWKN